MAQGGITGRLRYNGQRLRLLSIDTPETYKPRCDAELTKGREATARLRELVANAQRIEVVDSGQADKYDRRLVHLLIDGRDVGQTLMAEGLAVEWRPGPNAWRERRRHWCGYCSLFSLSQERPAAVIGTCVDPRRRKSHKPLIGPRNAAMPLEHGRFFLLKTKI